MTDFSEAEEQIELASRRGAELIGLPENFAFLGEDNEKLKLASELSIKCTNFLKTMSQRYQVFLLGGGYPVPAGDDRHTLNRSALFGKDGQVLDIRNHRRSYLGQNILQLLMCQDYAK